mmetsp:Transcript_34094/g.133442  ORF Transcript_34094/g.133442 Transcript_34094/m.133442 type:complete len:283 (+) Transcript_34094:936-1784(+)
MFDDLCLISEGQTLFCGPVDDVLSHFSTLGLHSPVGTNPAEFLADMISIDYSDPARSAECRDRISLISNAYEEKIAPTINVALDPSESPSKHVGHPLLTWWDQLSMLFGRSVRQVKRDRKSNMARIIPSITSALMFGMIYWRLGRDQSGIHNRLGFLMVRTPASFSVALEIPSDMCSMLETTSLKARPESVLFVCIGVGVCYKHGDAFNDKNVEGFPSGEKRCRSRTCAPQLPRPPVLVGQDCRGTSRRACSSAYFRLHPVPAGRSRRQCWKICKVFISTCG